MTLTDEEAMLIIAAVYNMRDEQQIRAERYHDGGFNRAEEHFRKMYCKYNNLYNKLTSQINDIVG